VSITIKKISYKDAGNRNEAALNKKALVKTKAGKT
jgi:hypothetical protein